MQEVYENNPSRVDASNPLVLGMSCSLWCDYGVKEAMIDQRLFPRILAISNQMWYRGKDVPFAEFQQRVQGLKPWFESQGYSFGPGLRSEVPVGYSWE
jgi:N-acetyl-beta-hexosaminidase